MSVFPVFNACFVGALLVGLFCWKLWLLIVFLIYVILAILIYVQEFVEDLFHYECAFWLFIFSEVMVFGTLLTCCMYFDDSGYMNLSDPLEIPFLGCFVLLGSSITITAFHHLLEWDYSWLLLFSTVILGTGFVLLQMVEIEEIVVKIFDTRFHGSRFCTIGTHFRHVLLGVIGMLSILFVGVAKFGEYRCTVLTWYWHFVDYVWLFVYAFVYVC